MRISHKHRFVFLAIPRTGSTTVRHVLDDYSDIKSVHILKRTDDFPFSNHLRARDLKRIFDRSGWDWFAYKRFCVIRNPWDRVVSLYHHRQRVLSGHAPARGLVYNAWKYVRYRLTPKQSFKDYVMAIDPKKGLTASLRDFICNENGEYLVDDVLRFEALTAALPAYLAQFGITVGPHAIPQFNVSEGRRSYADYYDAESRQHVENVYRYEIDRFGYRFDASHWRTP